MILAAYKQNKNEAELFHANSYPQKDTVAQTNGTYIK